MDSKVTKGVSLFNRFVIFVAIVLASQSALAQSSSAFVYVNNDVSGGNSVSAFSVSPNGVVTTVPGSPFATGGTGTGGGWVGQKGIAATVVGNFLYASDLHSSDIAAFSINTSTGALTAVPGSPFVSGSQGSTGISLAITPNGRYLYAGYYDAGEVWGFSIASNGALTPVPGSPFGAPNVLGIDVTPDGKYLAVSGERVAVFSIGSDGTLTVVAGSPFWVGAYQQNMDFNCQSDLFFGPDPSSQEISVATMTNGTLSPISGSPFSFSVGGDSVFAVLSPNDNFLFVNNWLSNNIMSLNVALGGALSQVNGSPFQNPSSYPTVMGMTQAGTLLFVANTGGLGNADNTMSVFAVGSDGGLTLLPGSPFDTGSGANGLPSLTVFPPKACGPAGPFAYVANTNDNTVSMIDIPTSLPVTTIPLPSGSGPWGAAISPDQSQVYVTNSQAGTVSVIDTASNAVIAAVNVETTPLGVAFTPGSEKQAYVVNGGSNSVSVLDTTTTPPTVVATVQDPSLNRPVGVAMAYTTQGDYAYVTNYAGNTVSVIAVSNRQVIQTIPVGTGPRWVAITPDSSLVYVENSVSKDIYVLSVTQNDKVVAKLPINASPFGTAFTPDSKFAYVADNDANAVSVIDTASSSIVTTVGGFNQPAQVAISTDGALAYVTNANNTVSVIDTASNTIVANVTTGSTPVGVAIAGAQQAPLTLTQPLSPTQPNNFNFGTNNYQVQYPQGTQFSGFYMNVTEVPITQAEFQQRIAGLSQFAGASCIVYGGTGGNCVDDQVTCSNDPSGQPHVACPPPAQGGVIGVETDFTALQQIVNPGYLTATINQNDWKEIFTDFSQSGPLGRIRGSTSGFSEFVAVDLGANNPQGQAQLTLLSPKFPVTYSQGQQIPISIQLNSVVPPYPPVTDGQAWITVVMIADSNGNPTQQVVLSPPGTFQQQGSSGVYNYALNAISYAAGTYNVTIYGTAFPSYQGQFTISPQTVVATTTSLSSSLNPSHYGQCITLTASVTATSGTPTGYGIFYDGETSLGTEPLTNGSAQLITCSLTGGKHSLTAYYPGNGIFLSSTSNAVTQVIKRGGIAGITLTSKPNPSLLGQQVTFTTVVSGTQATPTGTVTFKQGSKTLGIAPLVNGQATFTTTFTTAGTFQIVATYSGDQNYLPAASKAWKQVVNKYTTATSLTSNPNPSKQGQPVTFTATVSSSGPVVPTGKVTFKNGSKTVGLITLINGVATLTTSKLPVGNLSITATYNGDAENNKSTSSPLIQVVQQ